MNQPASLRAFNLSAWALNHQSLMAFFMLLLMTAGVISYEQLPRNEDPAFTIKTAVVTARWPGADVAESVSLMTDTLEKNYRKRRIWITSRVKRVPDSRLFMLICAMTHRLPPWRGSGIRCVKRCRTSRRRYPQACKPL